MIIVISLLVSLLITYKILKSNNLIKKEKMPKINFYNIDFLKYITDNVVTPVILLGIISIVVQKYLSSLINSINETNKTFFFFLLLFPLFLLHIIKANKEYKKIFFKVEDKNDEENKKKNKEEERIFITYNFLLAIFVYSSIVLLLEFIYEKIMILWGI